MAKRGLDVEDQQSLDLWAERNYDTDAYFLFIIPGGWYCYGIHILDRRLTPFVTKADKKHMAPELLNYLS
jgi:hypothetical protein